MRIISYFHFKVKCYNLSRHYTFLLSERFGLNKGFMGILRLKMWCFWAKSGDDKLKQGYENITSIKGIGKIGGIALLHLFIKYPKANQRQITSLAGLDPIDKSSGTSVQTRPRISKAGSKLYRGSLFMGVMTAIKYDDNFKAFFVRLKGNGKHTTLAQLAVMRKMIVIAHSLYKNNKKYDEEIYKKATGIN